MTQVADNLREQGGCQAIDLADGELHHFPALFPPAVADELFARLRSDVAWREEDIVLFGQRRRVPRRVAWYGDPGATYTYSGVAHEPLDWIAPVQTVRERVEEIAGRRFNSVLLNLYRDGRDGMGWHADDEPELGRNPVIASVSFGATRRFCMRHRKRRRDVVSLDLEHGSLLLMAGPTQHHWLHAVPKTSRAVGERINLTFRTILTASR